MAIQTLVTQEIAHVSGAACPLCATLSLSLGLGVALGGLGLSLGGLLGNLLGAVGDLLDTLLG